MVKIREILILILVFSICFSASGWVIPFESNIQTKPIQFSGNLIIGTDDGTVYAIRLDQGTQAWKKTNLGDSISHIEVMNNKLLVFLDNGTIYNMKNNGVIESQTDLGYQVYGIHISENKAYISTKKGIAKYDGTVVQWVFEETGIYTAPTVHQGKIFFGKEESLFAIDLNGNILWETELGPFWKSKPAAYANMIYIGSMDHYFYALDTINGDKKWIFSTDGAITSSSLIHGGTIYFGSNDGNLYALDSTNGELKWSGKTNGGIFSTPELTTIGQENVVLIGSDDTYVYGFKRNTGEFLWGYSTTEPIKEIAVYGTQVLAISQKHIYSVPTDRSCVITEPADRDKVGYREVEIKGKVFSKYANPKALININGGAWESITVDENNTFNYILDPNPYNFGAIEVQCKVIDSNGQSPVPTKLTLMRSSEFAKPEFVLDYPAVVTDGKEVIIYVYDKETGESVNNFNYKIGEKTSKGNASVKINSGGLGEIEVEFTKAGYQTKKANITVEFDFIPYVVGLVILAIIVVVVWFKFLRKKPAEE